jgi:hypothetical protein
MSKKRLCASGNPSFLVKKITGNETGRFGRNNGISFARPSYNGSGCRNHGQPHKAPGRPLRAARLAWIKEARQTRPSGLLPLH